MKKQMLLEVKDLNIEFHDHSRPETVVHHFELSVEAGEIIGIVGESGSGKTMTALAIAGLLRRHDMKKTGEIIFDNENLLDCPREILRKYQGNDISMIFQEPMTSLNPVQRIGQQVEESLRLHTDISKEERYQRVIQALKDVELTETEKIYKQYPHELSGGMRQRVMIASAMICNPKILIADEATTALDVTIQEQIVKLLLKLNQEKNTAILFISHDLSLVHRLCKRVIVMQGGNTVEMGETEAVYQNPEKSYTRQLIAAIPRCEKIRHEEAATVKDTNNNLNEKQENVLEVSELNVGYTEDKHHFWQHKSEIEVCKDITFQIKKGEIVGLLGESGCGKSTLAKSILGMTKITSGKVVHTSLRPQMVFQDPYNSLNPSKTIEWILQEPLRVKGGYSKGEIRTKVSEMLLRVGLSEKFKNRYPYQLSGGQRQRVCIAAALMLEPALLIADEPVSALDVTVQAQIIKLLLKLHKEMGLAILFISHDLRVVYQMCDRVMVMQGGRIVEEGSTGTLYHRPQQEYTKLLLKAAGI